MADALLAFGVDGVRKNRHRPAKRPPDLPPHRRSPAACGNRPALLWSLQTSGPGAAEENLPPCAAKRPALLHSGRQRAFRRQPEGGREGSFRRAGVHAAKALRPCSARPGKRNRAAAPLCRETARQQQRAPPGQGRPSAGHAPCPLPAEETHPFPRTALLFQGGAPVRRGLNTG